MPINTWISALGSENIKQFAYAIWNIYLWVTSLNIWKKESFLFNICFIIFKISVFILTAISSSLLESDFSFPDKHCNIHLMLQIAY